MFKKTGWGFALIALILGGCIYFLSTGRFILGSTSAEVRSSPTAST